MAVILMASVILYGIIASVPLFFLALAGLYALVGIATFGPALGLSWLTHRLTRPLPPSVRLAITTALGLALAAIAAWLCYDTSHQAYYWLENRPFFEAYKGDTLRRLPGFEMTTLQFYAWWPMKLILILLIVNLIWATIRRIEFKFVNLGVLTVHTGIVVIAIGSIVYSTYKVEGDAILFRPDQGGSFVSRFYDAETPALYFQTGSQRSIVPLHDLPRYNDYPRGSLDLAIENRPQARHLLPENLSVTIPGFYSYAQLEPAWVRPDDATEPEQAQQASPALKVGLGPQDGPDSDAPAARLLADVPAERVMDHRSFAVEYLSAPSQARVDDLLAAFPGSHGLVVEVPDQDFRKVYAIEEGQTIEAGDTGYTINVEDIGEYGMPFATEGYEGANDTRARLQVTGHGKEFRRIALHRYPERSQDFVPAPDDPGAPPMGRRQNPDSAIKLRYLDNTKAQFHIVAADPEAKDLLLIARLPGQKPFEARLQDREKFVLGQNANQEGVWLHIQDRIPRLVKQTRPEPTPENERDPEQETNYTQALMPVHLQLDRPESEGGHWERAVWLAFMKYPHLPQGRRQPKTVNVPGHGQLTLTFSRQEHQLPFAMRLKEFEMTPYPGSNIPNDFKSTVEIVDIDEDGRPLGEPETRATHLNNPIVYHADHASLALRKVKISQSGWDPPSSDVQNPEAKNEQGNFIHQQRYTILGIGNNVAIQVIFVGSIMVVAGIPWAFFVKPWLLQRQKEKLKAQQQARSDRAADPEAPDLAKMPTGGPEPATTG
jgi:hypothetical protein